jgi:hypothetical protein
MLIQEVHTDLAPTEVVDRARVFFTTRFTPYAGFASDSSDGHIRFRFEAGVLTVGAVPDQGRTLVRGSTSRAHHELSQFLATLARPEEVRQSLPGPAVSGAG